MLCNRLQPDPDEPGHHRGFGYVEFLNAQIAADAVSSMNQFNLGGQLLRVCKAISPPEGFSTIPSTGGSALPPATAVAAASVTAKILSMETEQVGSLMQFYRDLEYKWAQWNNMWHQTDFLIL